MKTSTVAALCVVFSLTFGAAAHASHLACPGGGAEDCAFGVVPFLAADSDSRCSGGPLWNNSEWKMVTVRCKDGVANPGPETLGGAGGNACCQTAEHIEWRNEFLNPQLCQPLSTVYDECDPGPEPPDCRGPNNSVGSCIGDPVDVTTGNLEQMATDLDLGRGLAFTRHYASDEDSAIASPLGAYWRHGLDWRLVYNEDVHQANMSDPDVETALVWRPLGGSDLFLRFTMPQADVKEPWKGGRRGGGGFEGDPANGFVYTSAEGTRVYFHGQTHALEKIQAPGEIPIVVGTAGNLTTFTQGAVCLAVTTTDGKVESVASRPAADCSTGPSEQLWTYGYDPAGCLATVTANGYPGVDPPQGETQGVATWRHTYLGANCARLERVERRINSGAWVVLSEWTYTAGGRVTSVDEPALDQKLYLSYPATTPTVTEVRDASGTALLATVTADARRTRIVSASGTGGPGFEIPFRAATFTEDPGPTGAPVGLWKTTTDSNGIVTLYEEHDARARPGRIVEGWVDAETDLEEPGHGKYSAPDDFARVRTFTYHPNLDAETSTSETSVLNTAGLRETIDDYDTDGDTAYNASPTALLRRRIVKGWTLDASGNQIAFTDTTEYSYDPMSGRVTQIKGPYTGTTPAQYEGPLTKIDYVSTSGPRSAVHRYPKGDSSDPLTWTFSNFDARGNPQTVTDPNDHSTTFSYDGLGRVLTATPPDEGTGSTTVTFKYDVDGNLERVDFPPDSASSPVFLRLGYDAAKPDLLRFLADSQGNAIVYTYETGRATREERYTGFVDLANPGTRMGDAAFGYYKPNDPPNNTSNGRLWKAFNPLFAGNTVHSEFDYDEKGNPTSIRDENGKQDDLIYDALDRLTQIRQLRADPEVTYATDFKYDALSNVTRVTDAAGKATDLLHDDRGNLVETVSPDTGRTRFLYDAAGNLVTKIENAPAPGSSGGRVTTYGYDGLDRLTAIHPPNDPDWIFTYDTDEAKNQKGRLAAVTNGVVTTQLEYKQRGDVAIERTIVDGLSYAVQYEYDAAGNRTRVQGPSGSRADTSFAGLRPSAVTVVAGTATRPITDLAWYPFGPRTQAMFPPSDGTANTVVSTRTVNLRGQVTELDVTSGATAILDRSYKYDYTAGTPGPTDPGPNLDRVEDHVDATQSRFYFYDELDRLGAATELGGHAVHQYFYDAAGNRTSEVDTNGAATVYAHEPNTNRLNGSLGYETRYYAHDAYGNRIYDGTASFSGTPSLLYDDANRLVEVRDPANAFATIATYRYDAFGRRVRKVAGTQTILFFYDSEGHPIEEIKKNAGASNDQARFYVFVDDELVGLADRTTEVGAAVWLAPLGALREIEPSLVVLALALAAGLGVTAATRRWPVGIAATTSGVALLLLCAGTTRGPTTFRWVHTDPLGTPLAVTNSPETGAAAAIWRARYEPFGKATVDEDPDGNNAPFKLNVRFPGQYADAETGWHSNTFRTYDPNTARYLESDPIGLVGGINSYLYVENDPANATDPLGLLNLADSPIGRAVARIPIDGEYGKCLADCIENGSLGLPSLVPPVFARFPKEWLPPFRYISTGAPGAGGTTVLRSLAGVLKRRNMMSFATRRAIGNAGRALSKIATPLTVGEGAYSYALIAYCTIECADADECPTGADGDPPTSRSGAAPP